MTTTKRFRPMDPVNTLSSGKISSFLDNEEVEEDDRIILSSNSPLKSKITKDRPDLSKQPMELDFEFDDSPLGPLLKDQNKDEQLFTSVKDMPGEFEVLRIRYNDFSLTNEDCWIKFSLRKNASSLYFLNIYVYKLPSDKLIEVFLDSFNNYSQSFFHLRPRDGYLDLFVNNMPKAAAKLEMEIGGRGLLRLDLKPYESISWHRIESYVANNAFHKKYLDETYENELAKFFKMTKPSLSSLITASNYPAKKTVVEVDGETVNNETDRKLLDVYRLRRTASVNAENKIRNTSSYFCNMTKSNRLPSITTTSSPETNQRKINGIIDWSSCEPTPVANPQLLFIYPDDTEDNAELKDSFGSVAITSAELPRLEQGIFLNDRLIDFDLMHTQQAYQTRRDVHVFCSLFFRELKTMGREGVRKWTPQDLFSKRFLVIPVNEYLHWYLVIICNSHRLLVDITKRKKKRELLTVGSSSTEENEEELEEMETIQPEDKCFILILDSLGSRARPNTIDTLSKYMAAEALEKHHVDMNPKLLTGISPKVPQQDNHTDCGLFLLEFFERFIGKPEEFEEMALQRTGSFYFGLKWWFKPETASQRRNALKSKVLEHQAQYQLRHPVQSEAMQESASSDLEIIE